MKLLIIVLLIGLFILGSVLASRSEAKRFNNGICKHCENELYLFAWDSQGGRGYTCKKCGYTTWVSYPGVDKKWRGTNL